MEIDFKKMSPEQLAIFADKFGAFVDKMQNEKLVEAEAQARAFAAARKAGKIRIEDESDAEIRSEIKDWMRRTNRLKK